MAASGPSSEVANQWRGMRQREQMLIQRLTELEQQLKEHEITKEALEKLPTDRKCFHLVGGTLVPRTVETVLPQVSTTLTNLTTVVAGVKEQLGTMAGERAAFEAKHGIKASSAGAA